VLNGGGDRDIFRFVFQGDRDTIIDFDLDLIDLRAYDFTGFGAVMATAARSGGGTIFDLENNTEIVVMGMTPGEFTPDDFIL
jgi:hypothetical protein